MRGGLMYYVILHRGDLHTVTSPFSNDVTDEQMKQKLLIVKKYH